MEILNWQGPLPAARGYWKRGGLDEVIAAIRADEHSGRLPPTTFDLVFGVLPFLALEDAARNTGHARLNDALTDPRFLAAVDRVVSGPEHRAQYKSHAMEYWFRLAYEASGRHEYEVSPGLAQRLRHTELRGLTCDDLHLPHHCLLVRVPIEAELTLPDGDGSPLPVTGMFLVEEPEPDRGWRVCVEARRPDAIRTLEFFGVRLPFGVPLNDALAAHQEKVGSSSVEWRDLWTWAMNTALYVTNGGVREEVWRNREARQLRDRIEKLPKGEKRDRLRAQLKEMDTQRRIILGPGVPPLEPPTEGGTTGRPLVVRSRVSGHWKSQAHGPERRARKVIWVQPYWRGPEECAAPATTTHQVR